jgi:hypothetical protein
MLVLPLIAPWTLVRLDRRDADQLVRVGHQMDGLDNAVSHVEDDCRDRSPFQGSHDAWPPFACTTRRWTSGSGSLDMAKDTISHTDQQVTVLVEDAGHVRPIRWRDEVRHGTSSLLVASNESLAAKTVMFVGVKRLRACANRRVANASTGNETTV